MRRKKRTVSIEDVAVEAGASIATVSRILSNARYPVRAETRQRVLEAARRLDYVPNGIARALVSRRSGAIAVIVHDVADSYFAEIVRGIEDACQRSDYLATICSSDRDPHKELQYMRLLRGFHPDGLIFAGGELEDHEYLQHARHDITRMAAAGIHVVALARHVVDVPSVRVDNEAAVQALMAHLTALGHRRIAYIAGSPNFTTTTDRLTGYRTALAMAGLPFDPNLVAYGHYTREGGYETMRGFLAREFPLTAVLASSDLMAVGALLALREAGRRVPDDISLAGIDDVPVASALTPALTTVRVPLRQLGARGVQLVLDGLAGRPIPPQTLLDVELVVRDSTGPMVHGMTL